MLRVLEENYKSPGSGSSHEVMAASTSISRPPSAHNGEHHFRRTGGRHVPEPAFQVSAFFLPNYTSFTLGKITIWANESAIAENFVAVYVHGMKDQRPRQGQTSRSSTHVGPECAVHG